MMAKAQNDLMSTLLETGMKQLSKKLEKEVKDKVSQAMKEATGGSAKSDKKTDSKKKESKTGASSKKKTSGKTSGSASSSAKASVGTLSKALKPKVVCEIGTKKLTADELIKLAQKDAVKQVEGTIKKLEVRVSADKGSVYYLVNDGRKKYELL